MRKLFRSEKAVSVIISTILMIMVVMIGMTIVFSAVVFYADNYQAKQGSSILESLTIEDVWITNAKDVQLSLYNTATPANLGTDSGLVISVATIFVNGTALNPISNSHTIDFSNAINPGARAVICCQYSVGTFASGNTYVFKVVTGRGSDFVSQPVEY